MTPIKEENHPGSSASLQGKDSSSQPEHVDPIKDAAVRNNMTVEEYVDAVRGFAAYVANIIFSRE